MTRVVYRYKFAETIPFEDIECSLLLAIWAAESLHGEAEVRLQARHTIDHNARRCVIDSTHAVGCDLNRLFVGFLTREYRDGAFSVARIEESKPATAAVPG